MGGAGMRYGQQFRVRLPQRLIDVIRQHAERKCITPSSVVRQVLADALLKPDLAVANGKQDQASQEAAQ